MRSKDSMRTSQITIEETLVSGTKWSSSRERVRGSMMRTRGLETNLNRKRGRETHSKHRTGKWTPSSMIYKTN